MKFTPISIVAVILVVIALVCAGCSGTSSTTPAATPAAGGSSSGGAAATAAAASGSSSSGPISGSSLFGGLSYNFYEYKITTGSGDQAMTIYQKWTKDGKCTIRFEGAGAAQMAQAGMPTTMDCSATGSKGQSQSNPNNVGSDVKFVKVGTESVTVPAGTFIADKYTTTVEGNTATYWIASGKPTLKIVSGTMTQELNSIG